MSAAGATSSSEPAASGQAVDREGLDADTAQALLDADPQFTTMQLRAQVLSHPVVATFNTLLLIALGLVLYQTAGLVGPGSCWMLRSFCLLQIGVCAYNVFVFATGGTACEDTMPEVISVINSMLGCIFLIILLAGLFLSLDLHDAGCSPLLYSAVVIAVLARFIFDCCVGPCCFMGPSHGKMELDLETGQFREPGMGAPLLGSIRE